MSVISIELKLTKIFPLNIINHSGGICMLVRKKKKLGKLKALLLLTVLTAIIAAFLFDRIVDTKIKSIAEVECESYAERVINDAALFCIDEFSDVSFINKSYNSERVSEIAVNTDNVNEFKSMMAKAVNDKLSKENSQEFKISLSTVLGSNLFTEIAPEIEMSFQKEGSVNVSVKSEFSESGVNQTLHRIYVNVSVTLVSVTPAGNFTFPYDTDFLLSETVIVGETPSVYAGMKETEKST